MGFINSILIIVLILTPMESWIPANCPLNCTCSGGAETGLWVDCRGLIGPEDLLSKQLGALLSSNVTQGRLTALTIVNTSLTQVPRSVCRLMTLKTLSLDSNRLAGLPDNCLTNLTRLNKLKAIRNNIAHLQDGLFDGLHRLRTVILRQNWIASIDPRVFTKSPSLSYIDLSSNLLRDLDKSWIYVV